MDKVYYDEMLDNFCNLRDSLIGRSLYLFGHCEATLVLADLLLQNDLIPVGILDNCKVKRGQKYRGIMVMEPEAVLLSSQKQPIVLIVTRFYESMNEQLRRIGFGGDIVKLVDYNTYAEYSLSEETRERKYRRVLHGAKLLHALEEQFQEAYFIFCPFNALGDVYFCMSYLPLFLKRKKIKKIVVSVPSDSCAAVARLFGTENVFVFKQKELDAVIQAAIYFQNKHCFIAHQDRPYVINLHRVLKLKKIPLNQVYCCGVFGLPKDTEPVIPTNFVDYIDIESIPKGEAVILSPYAKSVTLLSNKIWRDIVLYYQRIGKTCFTNITGAEIPIEGTLPISPKISEMKSVVERAGCFVGIRSGMCDVLRTADAERIALFPDYNYCDTQWKAIDMYYIEGWRNLVVTDNFQWEETI